MLEVFKLFPLVIDFYNYFGYQMKILTTSQDYFSTFNFNNTYHYGPGNTSIPCSFNYPNIISLFDEFDLRNDTMRLGSSNYQNL